MTQKKKILYVITKSNWGGAQRYVYDVATNLPKEEFEVAVALGGTGLLKERLKEKGVRTISVPSFQRDISIWKEIKALFELYSIIHREKPDIVHLNSSKAGGLGAFIARLLGIPNIIFTAHGWPFREDRFFLSRILIWLASWVTQFFAHTTIAVSKFDQDTAPIPSKSTLIYNGIAPLQLGTGDKIRSVFPHDAHIVGTIGELTHNKNHISLVEETRNNPSLYVAIVGEGELYDFLEKKIDEYGLQDRVKLFGFIPVHEALRGFDTFALPSLKEGLPYVLLEAKMAGLPIKASNVGGVSEILNAKDMNEFTLERMLRKTIDVYTLHS